MARRFLRFSTTIYSEDLVAHRNAWTVEMTFGTEIVFIFAYVLWCLNKLHNIRSISFSVPWSDSGAWNRFQLGFSLSTTIRNSVPYAWTVAQVLDVLASAYAVIVIAVFASALWNSDKVRWISINNAFSWI